MIVRSYEAALLPVRRRATGMMLSQRIAVIGPAGIEPVAVPHQPVPDPVADLVPEMADPGVAAPAAPILGE